ncbi:GDPmannose 4,6-dehydratase [Desulfocicer vacuolatum DSM 3385]|uniref:GDP-mannose 4,6-dehydratase n=1 Tax=Desulfocicer vacuolatum DSM 3385 TaxID=1121400 RepID=A0A1W2BUB2_9BACT|nr:GDP-mannose 4,6-dehydratase [Desulfocicer vacuolatum]SMC76563.1 GDPmannose 4,6-dehydratase [Desulfocicer vacuolatum DSM 3385]
MKKAIIFGISGQDGAFLSKILLEKGYQVVGVSRNINNNSFVNLKRVKAWGHIELISCSMLDFDSVFKLVEKNTPDEIYDLSGQSSVALSFKKPVETYESISIANMNLLEVLRRINGSIKLFNAGSSECFGNTQGKAATENTPFFPRSPYAVAKASACFQTANYREAYKLFACTGILFNHESFLRPETFVTRKIVNTACRIFRGSNEKLVLGNISIERDWGWAPEYVNAMWLMLQQEKPDDFVIATGRTCQLEQFIISVFETLGLNWKNHLETDKKYLRPADIKRVKANPAKAEKLLKWKAEYTTCDVARLMVEAELQTAPVKQ